MKQTQQQVGEWHERTFPDSTASEMFEGIVEEVGELAHARLKGRQGLMKNAVAEEKDAIGDILVFLLNYCNKRGFCLETILAETWEEVRTRNYEERGRWPIAGAPFDDPLGPKPEEATTPGTLKIEPVGNPIKGEVGFLRMPIPLSAMNSMNEFIAAAYGDGCVCLEKPKGWLQIRTETTEGATDNG